MSDTPDLSMLFQMMNDKNIDLSSLMQNMAHRSTNHAENESSNTQKSETTATSTTPDMDTMLKMANLMNRLNSTETNASTNLLYALKPFLRDSKKEKVDQYAQFLKISSILNEMNQSGGDKK